MTKPNPPITTALVSEEENLSCLLSSDLLDRHIFILHSHEEWLSCVILLHSYCNRVMCNFIARHSEWCNRIFWMEWSYQCAALKSLHFIFLNLSGMSENYVVFIEQPIKMDLFKIVTGRLRGKSLNEGVYWDPNQETIFHLIDKQTGKVRQQSWLVSQRHWEQWGADAWSMSLFVYLFADYASYGYGKLIKNNEDNIRLFFRLF